MKEDKEYPRRTGQQNKALHVYCKLLAKVLNDAGLDMKKTLKPEVDIPWNTKTVKEYLWRPIQKAVLDKESTTELTTVDPSEVYDILNSHLSTKFPGFDLTVEWPSYFNNKQQEPVF